jgi:diguanylate cyclase (GGDEF)-like protein/PAS domain S-box-containing protein
VESDVAFYRSLVDGMSDGVYFVDRDRVITYWSQGAERLTGYLASQAVGRGCCEGLLNHVDESGRELCSDACPLWATLQDGRPRDAHVFLRHADGHRQPVWVRAAALRDDAGAITGAVEVFSDDTATVTARARISELEQQALTDPLTGLGNRRYLEMQLGTRLHEWVRYGVPLGVLMVDVDMFKRINEEHGHEVGDRTLAMVARTLAFGLRGSDIVARSGGEEFVIVSPHTDLVGLGVVGERLRGLVAASHLESSSGTIAVTISLGGTLAQPGDDVDTLLRRAECMVYAAKDAGRNQVHVESGLGRGRRWGTIPAPRQSRPAAARHTTDGSSLGD